MDSMHMPTERDLHPSAGFACAEMTLFAKGGLSPIITDDPDFLALVAASFREWDQVRVISRDHEWERDLRVEHKDGNKVLTRVLSEWRAPAFSESELHRLSLSVTWLGDDGRWAVVADNGSEPLKRGIPTRALAVEALRGMTGASKSKSKKEAA